jgi:catechol-2,3-dioxygenase
MARSAPTSYERRVTVTFSPLFRDAPVSAGLFHIAESCDHAAKLADFVDHESK